MKLNIQEIRKQSEGLHFEQTLDLAADLHARNQEILDVKDIFAVGKVQYEDRMYFLDYQLSYTIVLASSRSMEPVELVESYPVTEVFMEGATNQLDQEVLDDDWSCLSKMENLTLLRACQTISCLISLSRS